MDDWVDSLLAAASCFDWISPTLALAQDIVNGPSHTLLINVRCGWTGNEIASLLRENGVHTWGHMIVQGHFMITVPQNDAEFSLDLLEAQGLPVMG